jgi:hypothetical protein
MSNQFYLRPELFIIDGAENPQVFNSFTTNGPESACLRESAWSDRDNQNCFTSWSWDLTKCTDMLPFKINNKVASGLFTQTSSLAASRGILPGCRYTMHFSDGCMYLFAVTDLQHQPLYEEMGSFTWTRLSRTSSTDSIGGNNMNATLQLQPQDAPEWGSVWIAREKFDGSFQSGLGIATFSIVCSEPQ